MHGRAQAGMLGKPPARCGPAGSNRDPVAIHFRTKRHAR
jgi:hypothetical protein